LGDGKMERWKDEYGKVEVKVKIMKGS